MLLDALHLYEYDLPFRRPLRVAGRSLLSRRGLLVRLDAEGVEGWGEAAPLAGYGSDALEGARRDLLTLAAKVGAGGTWSRHDLLECLSSPSARFAVDTCLRVVEARRLGLASLSDLFPGAREEVAIAALLGPDTTEWNGTRGIRAVKIKVGDASVSEDVERVHDIRAQFGDEVRIRVDANRRWTLVQAMEFVAGCNLLSLDYIEEPVRDWRELVSLAERAPVHLAIDETLQATVAGVVDDDRRLRQALGRLPDVAVWVVKPTYTGSWDAVFSIIEIAREQRRRVVLSSAYETGIAMRALVALAAASHFDDPAGLDTYQHLAEDVLHPRPDVSPPAVDVRTASSLSHLVVTRSLTHVARIAPHVSGADAGD